VSDGDSGSCFQFDYLLTAGDTGLMAAPTVAGNIKIPDDQIAAFCRRHHIRQLALFGSVLRNDFGPDSDVDVLVEFEPGADETLTLLDLAGMQLELAGLFRRHTLSLYQYVLSTTLIPLRQSLTIRRMIIRADSHRHKRIPGLTALTTAADGEVWVHLPAKGRDRTLRLQCEIPSTICRCNRKARYCLPSYHLTTCQAFVAQIGCVVLETS